MDTDSLNSELNKFALVLLLFSFYFCSFSKRKEDITIFAYFIWLRQSFVFLYYFHIW